MSKKNLAVIFGGRSSEHEVSCISVVTIAKAVNLDKYNLHLIIFINFQRYILLQNISRAESKKGP